MHVVLVYVTKLVDSQEMLRQMLKQTIKMVRMCVVCVYVRDAETNAKTDHQDGAYVCCVCVCESFKHSHYSCTKVEVFYGQRRQLYM